jgi:hypothetical protein
LIEAIKESAMKKSRDKTDFLPGVLRARGFECNCTVALVTRLTPGTNVDVRTSLRITATEQSPPDGAYNLDVLGRVFEVERVDSKWSSLPL